MGELESLESLLKRYQAADPDGFEQFFRRTQKILYNFLLSRLRSQEEAEEVLQESYLKLHHNIARFDPSQSALGWTFQIARNVMIDRIRKNKIRTTSKLEDHAATIDPRQQLEARKTLEELVKDLPAADQALFEQKFLQDWDYDEIAKSANTSPANARQKVSRLLKRIRGTG